jgi:ribosome maturation factor RimP
VYRDIPEELRMLIEPVVEGSGLELVDVMITRGGRPQLLRVTIDTPQGDGRVSVERCADVSREIETQLDAADVVSGEYRLEVSSPGLDRLLAREKDFAAACGSEVQIQTRRPQKDFAAACGSEVQIQTRRPLDGRRRFRGRLLEFDRGVAKLTVDGREVDIPFEEVAKANTVYQFTRADFARRASSR